MLNKTQVISSFNCQIIVDEKDVVYLRDIADLILDKLPGAISATLSGAFKSLVSTGGYGFGVSSDFSLGLSHTRIKRYVDILADRYKIPPYIADQIEHNYGELSASILALFSDLNLPNIEDMHLTHSVSGHSVNIFKNTATGYATYIITGEILQLPYLSNTGYPFNTIKRVYQ